MMNYKIILALILLLGVGLVADAQNYCLKKGEVYEFNKKTGKFSEEKIPLGTILDNNAILKADKPFTLARKRFMWVPYRYAPCQKTKITELKEMEMESKDPVEIRVQGTSSSRDVFMKDNVSSILFSKIPLESKYDVRVEMIDSQTSELIANFEDVRAGQSWDLNIYNFADCELSCVILYEDSDGWFDLSKFICYKGESEPAAKVYDVEANSKTRIVAFQSGVPSSLVVIAGKKSEMEDFQRVFKSVIESPTADTDIKELKYGFSKLIY